MYGMAFPGNGGTPGGEVPLLRSYGCQHASRARMPPSKRTGKRATADGPRGVQHLQAVAHPPSSGQRNALHLRWDPIDRVGRPPGRYVVRVPQQGDTPSVSRMQTRKRGSTCGLAALINTDRVFSLLRHGSATATLVECRRPSASACDGIPSPLLRHYDLSQASPRHT